MGREDRHRGQPLRRQARAGCRSEPPGDGGQSRRLHQLHALRPGLPRGPGQRRDRHGPSRQPREDRLRFRRSDGRLDLRRLRRMRPGVPHRRADAGGDDEGGRAGRRHSRPHRRQPVPLLRRRLPAHLPHQGRPAGQGGGPGRAGQSRPAVRQGTVRLRLRAPPAAHRHADDPPRRESARTTLRAWMRPTRSPCSARRAGRRRWTPPRPGSRASATSTAAMRSPGSARPRAPTRRPICSRSWCGPGSAPTTSTIAPGSATPLRSRP